MNISTINDDNFFFHLNRIRTWCHYVVNIKYFERLMLFFIVLSTMSLAIEDPLDSKAAVNEVRRKY